MPQERDLEQVNRDIAARETAGDRLWFEHLLAPEFAMRRASMEFESRGAFLDRVEESAQRRTREVEILHATDRCAVVTCVVEMLKDETWIHFRNVRVFARPSAQASWQLLGWVNEPTANA